MFRFCTLFTPFKVIPMTMPITRSVISSSTSEKPLCFECLLRVIVFISSSIPHHSSQCHGMRKQRILDSRACHYVSHAPRRDGYDLDAVCRRRDIPAHIEWHLCVISGGCVLCVAAGKKCHLIAGGDCRSSRSEVDCSRWVHTGRP